MCDELWYDGFERSYRYRWFIMNKISCSTMNPVRIQPPLESLETVTISMGYQQYNQLCVYSNYMMWESLGLWLVSNIFDFRTSGWWSTMTSIFRLKPPISQPWTGNFGLEPRSTSTWRFRASHMGISLSNMFFFRYSQENTNWFLVEFFTRDWPWMWWFGGVETHFGTWQHLNQIDYRSCIFAYLFQTVKIPIIHQLPRRRP